MSSRIHALLLLFLVPAASAAVPDSYRTLWSDPAIEKRISNNIEHYRKGDMKLEIVDGQGRPVRGANIDVKQTSHAFLFGCNAFVLGQLPTPELNRKYEEAFVKLFNFATVPFYWEGTEPAQGELRYAEGSRDVWRRPPGDRFIPFAKKYNLTLKGHPLLWHLYNPSWLPGDAAALKSLYQKRFDEIIPRYRDHIRVWDVVNESLECTKKYPLYTPDLAYVEWAFREAQQRFGPSNLLMINEATKFSHMPMPDSPYFRQVAQLKAHGLRVEGAGFQFHLFSAKALAEHLEKPTYPPGQLLDVYEAFGQLDLPLFITEITIPTPAEDGEATQAEVIRNLYRLWFSAPKMAGITWWNLGDGTAVKGENQAKGGLVDADFAPKASYKALDQLINRDWKTNLSLKSDGAGAAGFRGFYGRYGVTVSAGGKSQHFEVELKKDASGSQKLTMK